MDSLTQVVLGAAVSVAVMRRRSAVWKAALWGGVAGTLPDLDVLIAHGDPILNMVLHRAESHALFWLTLFSLPFAWLVARVQGEWGSGAAGGRVRRTRTYSSASSSTCWKKRLQRLRDKRLQLSNLELLATALDGVARPRILDKAPEAALAAL